MSAVPKRKITRRMRGARRKGNAPQILKDPNITKVPFYKRTLVTKIIKFIQNF